MKRTYFLPVFLLFTLLFSGSFPGNAQQSNAYLSFERGILENTDQFNTLPGRVTENGGETYYRIGFTFRGASIATTEVDGIQYQFLHIDGLPKMGQVGAPALPARNEVIAMPPGAEAKISIVNSKYYEYDGFMIHPTLEPARDTEGAPEPEFQVDESIYGTDAYFPENIVEVTNVMLMRGIPLAKTQVRPVQFNPVTGRIRVYTEIDYKVEYAGNHKGFEEIARDNSLHFTGLLKRNVINSVNIPDGMTGGDSKSQAKEYIIITHSQYIAAANDLANWKRQLGYSVHVSSRSSWTAAQVKDTVEYCYDNWSPKPDYFVIIGDHTGSYAIPGEIHQDPSYGDDFATDLYFACMDGGSDWHPDLARGRISVSSLTEANVIVNKIINYELTPPTTQSFYDNILNCAEYQDENENGGNGDGYADRRFCHTSEDIKDYLEGSHGYTSSRVYYRTGTASVSGLRYNNGYYSNGQLLPSELRNASFNWSGDENDITAEIDAGKLLVFHRDHGYTGGIGWAHPFFLGQNTYGYPDHIAGLSNGNLQPMLFSMNCHTGEFQLDNCFAEEFLRVENKGAVGVIGAAYYSYSGYNDALSLGMIDAIWADPGVYPVFGSGGTGANYTIGAGNEIYTMGDVVNQGLYAMEQNWDGSSSAFNYQYELFHYFGDPAMKMWTENPNNNTITATHSPDIDCSLTSFSISGSEPGALATLVFDNALIGEAVLDGSGNGTINYSITGSGTIVKLTISKTNHKPYTADLNLIGTCNPPALDTDPATSVTQNSATLNGEILNDFGNTITESGFVYGTDPNPMIGGTGVTQVQTSPTVTMGTFSESISGLTPATTYFFKAYAISAGGTGYGGVESFTTSCGVISTLPFTQDFSGGALPTCWANIDNQGGGQVWRFDNPAGRTLNTTTGGNGFAILDSDYFGSGNTQDADLVTPEFDLSGYVSVNLYFEYHYRDYQTESGSVAYSTDGGSTWNTLQSWNSTTANAAVYDQDISSQVAGESSVMFKWNYTGTWGYYFMVDDLNISGVAGNPPVNQQIPLVTGWNILSWCVEPDNMDMMNIVQPLIDGSTLVKVSDEAGGFVQYITGVGWMNTIGDMQNTEGYYINLSSNDNLSTDGAEVTFPYDIPLMSGWNIMGYPCDVAQDAMTVLQPLIDAGYLVKVISESGGLIEYITGIGWINTINTFNPGEGYHINVNTDCTLTLDDPGKGTEPYYQPDKPQNKFFASVISHPFMPMNLLIEDIACDGFEVEEGDELAVFDGDIEVGNMVFTETRGDYYLISSRTDDPLTIQQDGFMAGNPISFEFWDQSENLHFTNVEVLHLYGDQDFTPLGTRGVSLKIGSLGFNEFGHPLENYLGQNYPNPYSGQTQVEYGLASPAHVVLSIYDVYGRQVKVVEDSYHEAGQYMVHIAASSLEPGIYYYRMDVFGRSGEFTQTRKMILY